MHVVQRGHNRRDCFMHDTDYLVYLSNLAELCSRTQCALHAYCLMTNHVHLLLTPLAPKSCAFLMRNLGQRYVQYFNRRYARIGTLWEGRFHSCLVESATYVIACYRYIERNPVRAAMVESAGEHPWSSHAHNSGTAISSFLTPHAEYSALATHEDARQAAYRKLFTQGDDPEFLADIRDATNGGFALLSERYRASLAPNIQRRVERKPPGPAPKSKAGAATVCEKEPQFELGLRPRTSP